MHMDNIKDIGELLKQKGLIAEAISRGTREAMKEYIRAGKSMVSWKDGGVVLIPPEELEKILEEEAKIPAPPKKNKEKK